MREIKFRVFDTKENKMIEHFNGARIDYALHYWETHKHVSDPMQFTGMRDKYGKDIYDGDILSSPHFDNNHLTHVVMWSDKYSGWFLRNLSSSKIDGDGSIQAWVAMKYGPYEVIGNIHQHAHLLEQNKC